MLNFSVELRRRIVSYTDKQELTSSKREFFVGIGKLFSDEKLCVTTLVNAIADLDDRIRKNIFKKQIGFDVDSEPADLVRCFFAELGIELSRAEMTAIIDRGIDQNNRKIINNKLHQHLKDFEYDTQKLEDFEFEITESFLSSEEKKKSPSDKNEISQLSRYIAKYYPNYLPIYFESLHRACEPNDPKIQNALIKFLDDKPSLENLSVSKVVVDTLFSSNLATRVVEKRPEYFFRIVPTMQARVYQSLTIETKALIHNKRISASNKKKDSLEIRKVKRLVKIIEDTKKRLNNRRYKPALTELKLQIESVSGESFTYKKLFDFKDSKGITYSQLRDARDENILIGECIKNIELVLANYTDPTIRLQELLDFNERIEAEASYQDKLLKQALDIKDKNDIIYSPTGVAIIHLTNPESKELKENKSLEEKIKLPEKIPDSRTQVIEARIAVDSSEEFKKALSKNYKKFKILTNKKVQSKLWAKRNELNPLHDEVIKFTQRIFHVLKKENQTVSDVIQKEVLKRIDQLIWSKYEEILTKYWGWPLPSSLEIDDSEYLNIKLKDARWGLTQASLQIIVDVYAEKKPHLNDPDNLLNFLSNPDPERDPERIKRLNHIHQETPSTTYDEFFTDPHHYIAARITGTGNTAHGKKRGADKQAKRYVWITKLTSRNEILPIPGRSPELRVPSIHAGKHDHPTYAHLSHDLQNPENVVSEQDSKIFVDERVADITDPTILESRYKRDGVWYCNFYFAQNKKLLGYLGTPVTVTIPCEEVRRYKIQLNNKNLKKDNKLKDDKFPMSTTAEKCKTTSGSRTDEFCKYIIKKAGARFKETFALEDNVDKLKELFDDYLGGEPRTYRLLTSFPLVFAKKERLHADSILKSAHIYNRMKLHAHDPRFAYVQSIPVNNSGLRLSWSINKLLFPSVAEAALMAEMAVLNTLRQTLKPISSVDKDISALYDKAEKLYRLFLNNNPQGEVYFHKSPEGKKVIKLLQKFRSGYAGELSSKALAAASLSANREALDIQQLVEHAVKVMFVHNKHLDLAYGRLIQAMTCFLDMCALGCKSGNERYAMISGREKVLSGMTLKTIREYSKEEREMLGALRRLSNAGNSIDSGLDALISPLATAYSAHHAAGISNASTLNDQGPSKIIPITNFLQGFDTNRTEDPEVSLCNDEADKIQPQNKDSDVFGTLQKVANEKISAYVDDPEVDRPGDKEIIGSFPKMFVPPNLGKSDMTLMPNKVYGSRKIVPEVDQTFGNSMSMGQSS